MLAAQLVEVAQRLTREVADLRIVAFGFELGDNDDGEHDGVFREPEYRLRIAQQHRGVEHECPLPLLRCSTSALRVGGLLLGLVECGHSHSIPGDVSPGWCYVAATSLDANLRGRSDQAPCLMSPTLTLAA